jgi:hypothetical protein
LSDIFVLEEHCVCETFGLCHFGEYHMCPVSCNVPPTFSNKNHPPNAHQTSFFCLVLCETGQHIPWVLSASDCNQNCHDGRQTRRCWEPRSIGAIDSR